MIDSIVVGAIATNCYVYAYSDGNGEESLVVVDPGGDADAIIARLERRRLQPSFIVLTHGHFDHLAGLPRLLALIAEKGWRTPSVLIHGADAGYLGAHSRKAHSDDFGRVGALSYVDGLWEEMPEPSRLIDDGDRVGPFLALHTPGHTPGSICLYDEAEGLLLSGDTLFAGGVGRTDLIGGDAGALARSLQRLLSLPDSVRVFPGHGSQTRIRDERW